MEEISKIIYFKVRQYIKCKRTQIQEILSKSEYNQIYFTQNTKGPTITMIEYEKGEDSDIDEDIYKGTVQTLLRMNDCKIRDVWADNFQQEAKKMMKLCQTFNVIAMDTEFPGVCVNRSINQCSQEENEYLHVRRNVEQTKLIQIGFSIADQSGCVPEPICTWQFNFKFDLHRDKIVGQAEQLLNKAGIRFDKLVSQGIDFRDFAEYFVASGIIFNKNIKWVVFHGSFDFAYLLRLMKGQELPLSMEEFNKDIKTYFPTIYDLKFIIKDLPNLKEVGLNRLSQKIGCSRIGPQHQAGSDSLLTLCCYFRMFEKEETAEMMRKKSLINVIFGVGVGLIISGQSYLLRQGGGDYLQIQCNEYYDSSRNYMMGYGMNGMNGMNNMNGMNMNQQPLNPLYHYMQNHQQNGYIYANHRGGGY